MTDTSSIKKCFKVCLESFNSILSLPIKECCGGDSHFKFALPLPSVPSTRSKMVLFMEDLVVIRALNHDGSFGQHFVWFRKKKRLLKNDIVKDIIK